MTRRLLCLLGALGFLGSCRPSDRADVGSWPGPDLTLEHSVWVEARGQQLLGRGVLRRQGDRLDLLVLAPTGQRLWTVHVEGTTLESRAFLPLLRRMDPDRLLDDVRWALFAACPVLAAPGTTTCRISGIRILEAQDDRGRPLWRQVDRHSGSLRVDFQGEAPDCAGLPQRIRAEDRSGGYLWEISVNRCRGLPPETEVTSTGSGSGWPWRCP